MTRSTETGRSNEHSRVYPRVLGRHGGGRPGPTVVVTGGVHGNEPAGCEALLRVLAQLQRERLPLRGELWGVAGNLRALAAGRRYIDRDLNRRWIREDIARIVNTGPEEAAEDSEQLELLELFAPLLARARAPIVFFDLHSTSGPAAPFSCMADVLRNRDIALALPLPVVLGLEEVLDGSLLGYLCDLGHIGVAVEGGQHDDPATIDCHESALWIMLVAAGALDAEQVLALAVQHRVLRHHLGVQQDVTRHLAHQPAKVPVGAVHHRRDAERPQLAARWFFGGPHGDPSNSGQGPRPPARLAITCTSAGIDCRPRAPGARRVKTRSAPTMRTWR